MIDADLKARAGLIAERYELELPTLLAVIQVESAGRYFSMVKGRKEPLIRFEGHYFYRLLPTVKRNKAVVARLAHPRAGRIKNPYRQTSRWRLLDKAIAIDRVAALSSVSWGLGQVMGSHWRWLGYGSIDALVAEARSGPEGQVRLMMRYVEKAGLLEALRDHDWRRFARGYNGPAYAKYNYHKKLERAFRRHGGKPKNLQRNRPLLLRQGNIGEMVRLVQTGLRKAGFMIHVDGDFGPATEHAVKAFQRKARLKADGIVGPKTFDRLDRVLA